MLWEQSTHEPHASNKDSFRQFDYYSLTKSSQRSLTNTNSN